MDAAEAGLSANLGRLALRGRSHAREESTADPELFDGPSASEEHFTPEVNGTYAPPFVSNAGKKKKKRSRAKKAALATEAEIEAGRVKISRNKHMRFISSYHVCHKTNSRRDEAIIPSAWRYLILPLQIGTMAATSPGNIRIVV